jgi:hypothetical protein
MPPRTYHPGKALWKTVPATLLAMLAGWAVPLIALIIGQLAASGRTADVGPFAFWTGLFAFLGWLVIVLPVITGFQDRTLFGSLRFGWLGWSLLGIGAYAILVMPLMGWTALFVLWYPAAMGAIAGFVFGLMSSPAGGTGDRPEENLAGGMNPRAQRKHEHH